MHSLKQRIEELEHKAEQIGNELYLAVGIGRVDQALAAVDPFLNAWQEFNIYHMVHRVKSDIPAFIETLPFGTPDSTRRRISEYMRDAEPSSFLLEEVALNELALPLKRNILENKDNQLERFSLFKTCLDGVLKTAEPKLTEAACAVSFRYATQGFGQQDSKLEEMVVAGMPNKLNDTTFARNICPVASAVLAKKGVHIASKTVARVAKGGDRGVDVQTAILNEQFGIGMKNKWVFDEMPEVRLHASLTPEQKDKFISILQDKAIPAEIYHFKSSVSKKKTGVIKFQFEILDVKQFFYYLNQAGISSAPKKS
jgi:hypothetical protein